MFLRRWKKIWRVTIKKRETWSAYLFLLPSLIGVGIFVLFPILRAFFLSFYDWNLLGGSEFVSLKNYSDLFKDPYFIDSLRNTAYFSLGSVPAKIWLGLLLALFLNRRIVGVKFFRAVYFLPVVCSTVAIALIWLWLYDTNFGYVNYFLNKIGLPSIPWLSSVTWAMPAVIIVAIWKDTGYNMVIFLAGLQGVPREMYEAAKIDGANGWQVFRYITFPMISPTTFFVTLISLIGSFQVFDVTTVLTKGGPGTATLTLVQYLYQCAFQFFKMGYASAIAYVLFVIVLIFTFVQLAYSKRWVHY